MSFDWSWGRRAPRGPYFDQLVSARETLGLAFVDLDVAQREATTDVRAYKRLLPDRAAKTGLAARFDLLDAASNEAMATYLALVDQHDPLSEIPELSWPAAARTLQDHQQVMQDLATQLNALKNDYVREFERIGSVVRDIREQVAAAARAVASAEQARAALAASGYELEAVDAPLARARLALRAVTDNKVELNISNAEQASSHICALAEQATELATEMPLRISKLSARRTSLTTRLAAISNTASQMPAEMSVLRREFSTDNFADLQVSLEALPALRAAATELLDRLATSIAHQDWDQALLDVTEAVDALDRLDAVTTAPRARTTVLRRAKSDPDAALSHLRFALKDARYLLTSRRDGVAGPWAARLDTCAGDADKLAEQLDRIHPDYWGVMRQAEDLERRVDELVEDFRASHQRT